MDLVSIIVPVYNVEKYLVECVKSLTKQSYERLEIILVDDGATDSSGKICDQLAADDMRIKVIHKNNAGLGYARNSGLEIATGKYVTFIDSDDFADDDMIERLVTEIKKSNSDTCIGGFKRIDEHGKIIYRETYEQKKYTDDEVYSTLLARMLGSSPRAHDAIRMSVWNVLYSGDIIRNNAIRFPSEREFISEDIIWDLEYYRMAKSVTVISSDAYNYRVTPGSLTQKYKPDMLKKISVLYCEIERRLDGDVEKINRLQRQFFVNLRSCIRQEQYKISKNNISVQIKKILSDETVKRVAKEYPIHRLSIKQQIFVFLLRLQAYRIMTLLLKIGFV